MASHRCLAILLLSCAAVLAVEDPHYVEKTTPQTLRFNFQNDGINGYKFDYENSDGTAHASQGLKNRVGGLAVTGSYTEIGQDGQLHTVHYIADEKGFRAVGDHIPQAQ